MIFCDLTKFYALQLFIAIVQILILTDVNLLRFISVVVLVELVVE